MNIFFICTVTFWPPTIKRLSRYEYFLQGSIDLWMMSHLPSSPSCSLSLSNFVFFPWKWGLPWSLPPLPLRPPLPLPPDLPLPPSSTRRDKSALKEGGSLLLLHQNVTPVERRTFAFWSTVRLLLGFDDLLQFLFLLVSLEYLPCNTAALHFQFPFVCLFGFLKGFFCVPIKKKRTLDGSNNKIKNVLSCSLQSTVIVDRLQLLFFTLKGMFHP